jgi:dGTPase
LAEVEGRWPGLERSRAIHEAVRRMNDRMVDDVLATTRERVGAYKPRSVDEVRALGTPLVGFSPAMAAANAELKAFLYGRMYRHPSILRMQDEAKRVVRDLFAWYLGEVGLMPAAWQAPHGAGTRREPARTVADYVSGMTDNFAHNEHRRLAPGRAAA